MTILSELLMEYLLEKDRTALVIALEDGDEFLKDEILQYLLEKQICPKCFNELHVTYEKEMVTNDPYPMYEDRSVGYNCDNCDYICYFE